MQKYFCAAYDYAGKADLSKGYVLFIMLYKVVLTFASGDENLKV